MKFRYFCCLTAAAIIVLSCDRIIDPVQKEKSTDLVVPHDFDWKTSRDVQVTVTGIPVARDFLSALAITDPDGKQIFSASYSLRDTLSISLNVPVAINELTLTYGSRTIKGKVEDGKVLFSFLQKDDTSDIGK